MIQSKGGTLWCEEGSLTHRSLLHGGHALWQSIPTIRVAKIRNSSRSDLLGVPLQPDPKLGTRAFLTDEKYAQEEVRGRRIP